jgi:hypothetical protein
MRACQRFLKMDAATVKAHTLWEVAVAMGSHDPDESEFDEMERRAIEAYDRSQAQEPRRAASGAQQRGSQAATRQPGGTTGLKNPDLLAQRRKAARGEAPPPEARPSPPLAGMGHVLKPGPVR